VGLLYYYWAGQPALRYNLFTRLKAAGKKYFRYNRAQGGHFYNNGALTTAFVKPNSSKQLGLRPIVMKSVCPKF
jgi:hypothetical protein